MIKPTGKCDICKKADAEFWFGNTAGATCKSVVCTDKMSERYAAAWEELRAELEMEAEMERDMGNY